MMFVSMPMSMYVRTLVRSLACLPLICVNEHQLFFAIEFYFIWARTFQISLNSAIWSGDGDGDGLANGGCIWIYVNAALWTKKSVRKFGKSADQVYFRRIVAHMDFHHRYCYGLSCCCRSVAFVFSPTLTSSIHWHKRQQQKLLLDYTMSITYDRRWLLPLMRCMHKLRIGKILIYREWASGFI